MDELNWLDDGRGPDGEILPPLLVYDLTTEEMVARLVADNAALGAMVRVPQRGHSREGLEDVAQVYAQQLRLREVLTGKCRDEMEQILYQAVTVEREPLSLRPLGLEDLTFVSFAPVLQRLSHFGWRVGLPERGRVEEFETRDPGQALSRAQALYVAWCADEDARFDQAVQTLLEAYPVSLFHDFWLKELERSGQWDRGGGFHLRMLGHHDTQQLETPYQSRIIETARIRGVRICDTLARKAQVPPPYPTPDLFQARCFGAITPAAVSWTGATTGLLGEVQARGQKLALVRREGQLQVLPVGDKRAKLLVVSVWEPVLELWLGWEDGRSALAAWAIQSTLPAERGAHV